MTTKSASPPDFTSQYDTAELPSTGECLGMGGNRKHPIEVVIDGEEITLNPGDVVETVTSSGSERHFFIKSRNGYMVCQELIRDHHVLFEEQHFNKMVASVNYVNLHRDPWGLTNE